MIETTYAGIAWVFVLGGVAALVTRRACAELFARWLENTARDQAHAEARRRARDRRRKADIMREANRPIYTAARK